MGSICRLIRSCKAGVKSCFQDSVSSCLGTSTSRGSSNIRGFSVLGNTAPPETCVMMGQHGLIVYPGKRWIDLDVFLDGKPLLDDVPVDRLFGKPDPRQPYMTTDASCQLMKSGLFLPYFCKVLGKSCSGAFSRENVGVIEDLGMFAYRKLEEDACHKWKSNPSAGYNEYSMFMKGIIAERHEPSSLSLLPRGLNHFFSCVDAIDVEPQFALDHPCLLSDEKYGSVLIEVSRLLRNEFRVFGKSKKAMDILRRISVSQLDCVFVCQQHPILNEYLPDTLKSPEFNLDVEAHSVDGGPEALSSIGAGRIHGLASTSIKSGTGGPGTNLPLPTLAPGDGNLAIGIILVDVNRHGSIHSVEFKLLPLVDYLPGPCSKSLLIDPYTRKEVIQLLRYKFPMYLPVAFKSFLDFEEWESFGARLIDPIPSIFSAPSTFP